MRVFLLVLFEIAAVFGIPRAIYGIRAALGVAPPVEVAQGAKEAKPVSVAPAKVAQAPKVERIQLMQISQLPDGRAVENLQASGQARRPAENGSGQEAGAPGGDDDYLPPWMREARTAKHHASPAESIKPAGMGRRAAAPAKHVYHRRHVERRAYSSRSRRSRRFAFFPW